MPVVLQNRARGTLASSIASTNTALYLATGQGAAFPALGASQYFYATLLAPSGVYEIVKVTARAAEVLTVVRGAESTTPVSFPAGTIVELRVTAQAVSDAAYDAATAVFTSMFATSIPTADFSGVPTYADNAAAVAGGLAVGRVYKTSAGDLRVVV